MSLEKFKSLLTEFSEAYNLSNLNLTEPNICRLSFDTKIKVALSLKEDEDTLVFFSEIIAVPKNKLHEAYLLLLRANMFWIGTAGATLGFNPEKHMATLGRQERIANLDLPAFEKILQDFVNTVEYWQNRLTQLNENDPTEGPSTDIEPMGLLA